MEFTTLTKRVGDAYEADVGAIEADAALAPGGSRAAELKALYVGADATTEAAGCAGRARSAGARAADGSAVARGRWLAASPPTSRRRREERGAGRQDRPHRL